MHPASTPSPAARSAPASVVAYGAHLPLISFDGAPPTLASLRDYARQAAALGYRYLCANDHLLFQRPWLDGPTALAATLDAGAGMTAVTTVALPVIRGPVQTAKLLTALDLLTDGGLIAGVGPGSSPRDYAAAGVPFDQRWSRFEDAVRALRALLDAGEPVFEGAFYSTAGLDLEPRPARPGGPPLWIASWGSPAGMRRVARLGDGWLASAYNTTPADFRTGLAALRRGLPNAIATAWLYVTDDRAAADRMLTGVLAPMLRRSADAMRELTLPIGSPEHCAQAISAYAQAGAERIFLWPLADEIHQLQRFRADVVPLVELSP